MTDNDPIKRRSIIPLASVSPRGNTGSAFTEETMRFFFCSALALAVALSPQYAAAQSRADVSSDDMMAQMEAAQAEARAQAVHPGDEALSCEQLQAEMTATMQDPAVQAQFAALGASAEGQMEAADEARGEMMAMMGGSVVLGLASSFVPGLGYVQMAQQRAMAPAMQARSDQNMAQITEQAQGMATVMPQLMRGERVHELAQAKQCAFVQEAPPQ